MRRHAIGEMDNDGSFLISTIHHVSYLRGLYAALGMSSPPTLSELLHLRWAFAADRDENKYRSRHLDPWLESIADRPALEKFYRKPLDILDSLIPALMIFLSCHYDRPVNTRLRSLAPIFWASAFCWLPTLQCGLSIAKSG